MKFPAAWTNSGNKINASAEPAELTARIDMSADVAGKGNCPECKRPMEVVTVAGTQMWACANDRITFPVANQDGKET